MNTWREEMKNMDIDRISSLYYDLDITTAVEIYEDFNKIPTSYLNHLMTLKKQENPDYEWEDDDELHEVIEDDFNEEWQEQNDYSSYKEMLNDYGVFDY